jgi:cyclopropane fatty-acyl-phospholipid synthase-like methyltransferase
MKFGCIDFTLLNAAEFFRRQAAKALLQPSDVVLEVGCCGGMTTSNSR